MTVVYTIGGQKGGVGKTTGVIALAAEWMARGKRVLVVDGDVKQRTLTTWAEVAVEKGKPVPTVVTMGATMLQPDQLPRLAPGFDVVIVDTPARLGDVQRAALMVADIVVLPCGPSAHDCWALSESLELVQQAQIMRPQIHATVLLTRKVTGTVIGREAREVLASTGLPVLETELGYRTDYQYASAAGLGGSTYKRGSAAAAETIALTDELSAIKRRGLKLVRRKR